MKDLLDIRKDIDKIDEQIVKLYEERMKLTSDVAEYKINTGKQIMRYSRSRILRQELSRKIMIFWWNMIIILSGSRSSVLIMHF